MAEAINSGLKMARNCPLIFLPHEEKNKGHMTKWINKNDKPRSQRVLKTEAISAKLISSPYGAKRVQTDDTHINPHIKEQKIKTKPRLKWVLRDLWAS